MGEKAPPALAAMITMPANIHRVGLSSTSFFNSEIITMDVVKLSKMAEKKKVNQQMIHIKVTILLVLIRLVMTENPSCASTTSTMVIAPKRKKRMLEISLKW